MRSAVLASTGLAIGALLGGAAPAAAQAPPKELKLECRCDKRQAKVGDDVKVTLTLTNHGTEKPIEVRPLALDNRSLSLRVTWTEKRPKKNSQEIEEIKKHYELTRFPTSRGKPAPLKLAALANGDSISATFTIPCVRAGELHLWGKYLGYSLAPTDPIWSNASPLFVSTPGKGRLGATIKTSHGTIEVELARKLVPATVSNFVSLARAGTYKDTVFFRKIPGAWIQGGDPKKNDGTGDMGWTIPMEIPQDGWGRKHDFGTLSMSRGAHVATAASQFFFSLRKLPQYDFGNGYPHAVFATIVKGPDVLRKIDAIGVESRPEDEESPYGSEKSKPVEAVTVEKVSIWVR